MFNSKIQIMSKHIIHRTHPAIEVWSKWPRFVLGISFTTVQRVGKPGKDLVFAIQLIHLSIYISWNETY